MSLKGQPVTAPECSEEWIAIRREVIAREGCAVRAGSDNAIEIQSINTGAWHRLTLPNEATVFTTASDRDAVLSQLIHSP